MFSYIHIYVSIPYLMIISLIYIYVRHSQTCSELRYIISQVILLTIGKQRTMWIQVLVEILDFLGMTHCTNGLVKLAATFIGP